MSSRCVSVGCECVSVWCVWCVCVCARACVWCVCVCVGGDSAHPCVLGVAPHHTHSACRGGAPAGPCGWVGAPHHLRPGCGGGGRGGECVQPLGGGPHPGGVPQRPGQLQRGEERAGPRSTAALGPAGHPQRTRPTAGP